jgi:hypothetical protein
VMARSNLRTAAYLAARYGQMVHSRPHWIAHFPRVAAPSHLFLGDLFVNTDLYDHIQRQIHLSETAIYEAAKAIAALRKPDLTELKRVHGKTLAARKALFRDWWRRNAECTELIHAMNQLLAPFNVELVKFVETEKHMMFDHYALKPTVTPWAPPFSGIPGDLQALYTEQWEELRQEMQQRKLELDRKWIKSPKAWEREVYPKQSLWLSSVTQQLQEVGAFVPYLYATVSPYTQASWDLRFVVRVNHKALIQTNVLADRVYLRAPFLDVHPKVVPPMSSLPPQEQFSSALSVPGLYPGAATQQMLVKVPATCPVGSNMGITVPSTRETYSVTVPPGSYPGTYLLINVPGSPGASFGSSLLTISPLASSAPPSPVPTIAALPDVMPVAVALGDTSPMPPRVIQMSMTVPAGVKAGDRLRFRTPQGQEMECVVPPNVRPGMQFLTNITE